MTETRFALFNDGRIMRSMPVALRTKAADYFTAKEWTPCTFIPGAAEFIGHYAEKLTA